jgi:hypothetical protein
MKKGGKQKVEQEYRMVGIQGSQQVRGIKGRVANNDGRGITVDRKTLKLAVF